VIYWGFTKALIRKIYIYEVYMLYMGQRIQAMIEIPQEVNHILNIIKARYGFKTKSEAIAKVVIMYGAEILEPELRPEYIEKLRNMDEEGKFVSFNSIEALKKSIEND